MRVNRRFLYWGLVLVAVGGVLIAADVGAIDTAVLSDALRLWPLAVVAVGLSLVLRRTQFALPALIAAALVPGLVVGAAFAVVPRFAGHCGAQGVLQDVATAEGTFDGPAVIAVWTGCGSLAVTTAAGNEWRLLAQSTAGIGPSVVSSGRLLSIDAPGERWFPFDGRDAWDLTIPTQPLRQLSVTAFAADVQVDLPDAKIGHLFLTANAASVDADASDARVSELTGVVNVGSMAIRLPAASDLTGSLHVGAGDLRICAPPELGLRITSRGTAETITVNGIEQTADDWQSPGYESATHRADLRLTTNLGAVEINPIGGCE
jgi:hypothetical protein